MCRGDGSTQAHGSAHGEGRPGTSACSWSAGRELREAPRERFVRLNAEEHTRRSPEKESPLTKKVKL